jgi:hypothetical protein
MSLLLHRTQTACQPCWNRLCNVYISSREKSKVVRKSGNRN